MSDCGFQSDIALSAINFYGSLFSNRANTNFHVATAIGEMSQIHIALNPVVPCDLCCLFVYSTEVIQP